MIELKELMKIYKSKKGESCVALDHVSFTLPDKGLVFIVGKSGSGKSTLLNLIGGLDEITSGEIIVDGVKFSEIKGTDGFDAFRNSYMGFVFQDYYLIDSLSVFENVKFALDLKSEKNENKVNEVLDKLGIGELALRSPKELSGGQQQRVAIARAIVKNPNLILADEPTGNLDELSATQILEILKDLSKNRLVLIVSHNLDNAKKYADRIIKLECGKIVSDVSRYNFSKNELKISKDEIVLPNGEELTEVELKKINKKLEKGVVKISQQKPTFVETVEKKQKSKQVKPHFTSSNLSLKSTCLFATKFTRLGVFNFIASTLIVSFILVLFGICQTLYIYNGNSLLAEMISTNCETFILQKGYRTNEIVSTVLTNKINRVTEQDLQTFRDEGYEGNMYLLYNDAIIYSDIVDLESYMPINQGVEFREFYARQAFGTLSCDESYLNKTFGNGGDVDYFGDPYAQPYGVIITDYIADCIICYNGDYRSFSLDEPYQKLINARIGGRYTINAVIKTNYREKYKNLINEFLKISTAENPSNYAKSVYESDDYLNFVDEARLKLNMAFVLSDDYFEVTRYLPYSAKHFVRFPNLEIYDRNGVMRYTADSGSKFAYVDDTLKDDELIANESLFRSVYPNKEFDSSKTYEVTLKMYDISRQEEDLPVIDKTFKIVRLDNGDSIMKMNINNFAEFRKYDVFPYAILFDNSERLIQMHDVGSKLAFVSNSPQIMSALTVVNAVGLYKNLFLIVAIVLAIAGFLILVNFGRKNVRSRTYEIGVLRALGSRKSEITKIFVLQMLIESLMICILSTCGMLFMIYLLNDVLAASLVNFTNNPFFNGVKLLKLNPVSFIINLATAIIISIAAFVVPLIMLSRIKPINIIKNRE